MSRNVRLANNLSRLVAPRAAQALQVRAVSNAANTGFPESNAAASSSAPSAPSSSGSSSAGRTTHFGFQTIPEEEKESLGK
jgi:hypothetical protein